MVLDLRLLQIPNGGMRLQKQIAHGGGCEEDGTVHLSGPYEWIDVAVIKHWRCGPNGEIVVEDRNE